MNQSASRDRPPEDRELQGTGLPLSLPPRVVDGAVVTVVAALYAAFLTSGFLGAPVSQHHLVLMAVFAAPSAIALWWRRRYPLQVLVIELIAALFAFPVATAAVLIALYTATQTIRGWRRLAAWSAAAAVSVEASAIIAQGYSGIEAIGNGVIGAALAVALGLWVGVRRNYVARLRERALFAHALASFLPPEVADLVSASPSALSVQAEIEVTVLFSDIRGFSTFAEQARPRRVAEVVSRHLTAMTEVVRLHGGMLDKFAGDAVMAVFGAPKPITDHAARALECAVVMQHRQSELNREATNLGLPGTDIGIGVNSGTVVAGLVGGMGRVDYTVIGDTVNVAQRLQSIAGGGEILVSAATLTNAQGRFVTPVGSKPVKGRHQPVEVYRVEWSGVSVGADHTERD
jgi:class 3 adenylate cyclase